MTERFALKKISKDSVERAVERAEHYRLLNDPAYVVQPRTEGAGDPRG